MAILVRYLSAVWICCRWLWRGLIPVGSAATLCAPVAPTMCLIATVGVLIAHPSWPKSQLGQTLLAALMGAGTWGVCAVAFAFRARVQYANSRVYLDLLVRVNRLDTAVQRAGSPALLSGEVAEIRTILEFNGTAASAETRPFGGPYHWLHGTGYNVLYRRLHQAEADLLLIATSQELKTVASEEHSRLSGSKVTNSDLLQNQLDRVVIELREDPAKYFRYSAALPIAAPAVPPLEPLPAAPAEMPPTDLLLARHLLRSVRMSVDDYRDSAFEGIVRLRGMSMWTLFATGLVIYLVLLSATLADVRRILIIGAAELFLVGALVGLVNRLMIERDSDSQVEDYNLSSVRLLQTILLSGCAAVLGVVVLAYGSRVASNSDLVRVAQSGESPTAASASATPTPPTGATPTAAPASATPTAGAAASASPSPGSSATATASAPATEPRPPQLARLFDVENNPTAFLFAAIFGLAPGLLLRKLESSTNQLKDNIRSVDAR